MATSAPPDYDAIARAAEVSPVPPVDPALSPSEVQTRGPVIIDTTTGEIKNAETGASILSVKRPDQGPAPGPVFDVSLAAMVLLAAALVAAIVAVWLSHTLDPSQKFALCALVCLAAAERLWIDVRRSVIATEPVVGVFAGQDQE